MSRFTRFLRSSAPLLGLVLLFAALFVAHRTFQTLRLDDVVRALHAIPNRALALAAGCTVLSYAVLTLYDWLASIYAGHAIRYARTSFASFCAYALAHNLGFAAVSGAAVRYRLYAHWGLTPAQIAKVVGFCSLTFGLGGMVLGGAILLIEPNAVPLFGHALPRAALYGLGVAMWAVVTIYVGLSKTVGHVRWRSVCVPLPPWWMAILQVVLASADVAVTAMIFYLLLPHAPHFTYPRFLAVYLASYAMGLAANLPGGIGVFDTGMLLGLAPVLPAPDVLSALLVFRLYYYVIPLFLAGGLFAGNEALMRRALFHKAKPRAVRASTPDFAIAALAGMTALCGVLLLMLNVTDPRPGFTWIPPGLTPWIPHAVAEAGDDIPSLVGTALLALALGLTQRAAAAWNAAMALLPAAALFVALQGRMLLIPAALMAATLALTPFRTAFYRHTGLLDGRPQALTALLALTGCVLALAAFEPHVRALDHNSWWDLVLSSSVPQGLRASVLLAILLALAASWRLLRPAPPVSALPWNEDAQDRYRQLGAQPPARADGMVLGDQGRAALPFLRLGGVLLGLGDPAGDHDGQVSALWRLRDLARQEGRDAAIWQASAHLLSIYGDLGLTALPLGRNGLPAPALTPDPFTRFLCCVAERDLSALLPKLAALAAAP